MGMGEEEERVQGFCWASEQLALPLNGVKGSRGTDLDVYPGLSVCWLPLGASTLGFEAVDFRQSTSPRHRLFPLDSARSLWPVRQAGP